MAVHWKPLAVTASRALATEAFSAISMARAPSRTGIAMGSCALPTGVTRMRKSRAFLVVPFTEQLVKKLKAGESTLRDALNQPRLWALYIAFRRTPQGMRSSNSPTCRKRCCPTPVRCCCLRWSRSSA